MNIDRSKSAEAILADLQETALAADASKDKKDRGTLGKRGMLLGDLCIDKLPSEPACYYYRAMSAGIYYSAHIVGYQKGILSMIKDCEKVIELNPAFNHGAAYAMIGAIYTEIPPTATRPDELVRDLDKAEQCLKKALEVDPTYPENQIYMTKIMLTAERYEDARQFLKNSKDLINKWKSHRDYEYWQGLILGLEKDLKGH